MARVQCAGDVLRGGCRLVVTLYIIVFIFLVPRGGMVGCPLEGNLISIGPGMYPSNRTLDGGGRSILVLGSCEFMHNGTLTGLNYYVASSDWMILQIWRPVSLDAVSMMLVYERLIEPNDTDSITQLRFEDDDLHVLEGDRIGFTKLNHTFPIPYIFNPQMSADLWYNRVPVGDSLPNTGEVITFEEMGFPYHFSITVTFRAQVNSNMDTVMKPIWKHGGKNADVSKGKTAGADDTRKSANAIHKEPNMAAEGKLGINVEQTDDEDELELDDTLDINVPLGTSFPVTGRLEETTLHKSGVTSLKGVTFPPEPSTVQSDVVTNAEQYTGHPSDSDHVTSSDGHTPAEELTSSGPKFIFQTIMQTFSNLLPTSDGEAEAEEEEGTEQEVTSSAPDTADESDDVTDSGNADAADVTSVYSEADVTSPEFNDDTFLKMKAKSLEEKPNDTSD